MAKRKMIEGKDNRKFARVEQGAARKKNICASPFLDNTKQGYLITKASCTFKLWNKSEIRGRMAPFTLLPLALLPAFERRLDRYAIYPFAQWNECAARCTYCLCSWAWLGRALIHHFKTPHQLQGVALRAHSNKCQRCRGTSVSHAL